MPDAWANWVWEDINTKYGLKHVDTDMSSAEEIAKFKAEKKMPQQILEILVMSLQMLESAQGVTQPYKPTTWEEIPDG